MQLSKRGRNLVATVEGVEPYEFRPLPGRRGLELSWAFIDYALDRQTDVPTSTVLIRAVEGVDDEGEWREAGELTARLENELSLEEGYALMHAVFYWQTVMGIKGAQAFLDDGGGSDANTKAFKVLVSRTAPRLLPILLLLESASQTNAGVTASTATPSGTKNSADDSGSR